MSMYTLNMNRTFPAPRDTVFRAWTDAEELKKWWGPPGCTTSKAEIDLQPGGKYRFHMDTADKNFILFGEFREVQPPTKLVYTWNWEGSDFDEFESLVTVEFHERGHETEIVLTHDRFPTEKNRDEHNMGWSGCFDRLAQLLSH